MNKEQIKELVKKELKKRVLNEQEEYIEEGLLRRTLYRFGAGFLGAGAGTATGMAAFKGVVAALSAAGVVVSASTLGAIGVTLAGAGFLVGMAIGGATGETISIDTDSRKLEDAYEKFKEVVDARDDLLLRIEHLKDESKLPLLDKEFTRLTNEQIRQAQEFSRQIDREYRNDVIDPDFYKEMKQKVMPLALEGKLTFLDHRTGKRITR